ncbi:MAG TPA: DUF1906 domain-containing protein [Solirubrobacteraceae bacterium]|nr:DUF1906 domain-containing protein [Solirubrobacteraceae bacterium]
MTDIRRRSPLTALVLALAALVVVALGAAATAGPAAARTAHSPQNRTVRYHGYTVHVPAGWPVYRLTTRSHTCVRFDRHALYLGAPGAVQNCPTDPLGRTEAILIAPQARGQASQGANLLPSAEPSAQRTGRTVARIVDSAHRLVVTATWNRDAAVIRKALSVRSLRAVGAHFTVRRTAAASAAARTARASRATVHTAAAAGTRSAPGGTYTGLGFDACQTPSQSQMSAWLKSPFRAAGIYIGGTNMACSQPNLTSAWVGNVSASGWHIIPIYVGLQAPVNSCGCSPISPGAAASQGAAAAADAVTRAQAVGIGPGNPIYDDMEAYDRTTTNTSAVLAFLGGWTSRLHADGYVSGVYSSDSSGIKDLAARYGTSFAEPDDLWIANWNGQQSTADANVPASAWADHQRLHQYRGSHTDNYGGASINIDSDYVDAATAAAGTGSPVAAEPSAAPTLRVTPMPNGTLQASPSWRGEAGIASWQLEGGSSPTSLTPVGKHINAARATIKVRNSYAYYEVLALDSHGQTLGTSAPVATPAHVAMFGKSAYVPRRGQGGVPVACFELTSCRIVLKIHYGKRTVRNVKPQRIAPGGGIAHFKLSGYWHRLVAAHRSLPVTITVKSAGAKRISQLMRLVPYTTSGRRPHQSSTPSAQIRLIGGMEFVSHRGSGGVLAACVATAPCQTSMTLSARGMVIGRTGQQTLGAGMVGYLHFSLTRRGRTLLAHTKSNQLAVEVQISSEGATGGGASASAVSVASGQVTLAAF